MTQALFKASEYASVASTTLRNTVLFNIVHIENISKSKLNQIEDWKEYYDPNRVSVDRLKNTNQKIIREIKDDDNEFTESRNINNNNVIYKLLLRDRGDNFAYAYEQEPLGFLRHGSPQAQNTNTPLAIQLGGRLLVKQGATVQRGVIFLTHNSCNYLGIHTDDRELVDTLNDGLAKKEIDILQKQLGNV